MTDEQETLAIDTFRFQVDHKKVKLDTKERDKYPNIDGYIKLLDKYRIPVAQLEVQIRKLPDGVEKIPKTSKIYTKTKHEEAFWHV